MLWDIRACSEGRFLAVTSILSAHAPARVDDRTGYFTAFAAELCRLSWSIHARALVPCPEKLLLHRETQKRRGAVRSASTAASCGFRRLAAHPEQSNPETPSPGYSAARTEPC